MIYAVYDPVSGEVEKYAYSRQDMVPEGKSCLAVSEADWEASRGKVRKVVNGEFVWSDPQPVLADYDKAMEAHLLAERSARGYTLREPSDYKDSSVPRWAQDALDWIAHRDAVMLYGLEVMNHYAETGEAPTLEEFKAALPVIEWTLKEEA